jgi:hypothetical protein
MHIESEIGIGSLPKRYGKAYVSETSVPPNKKGPPKWAGLFIKQFQVEIRA